MKASDNYKSYVSPVLTTIDSSGLGYRLGPVCVGVSGVADDVCLLSDSANGLQQLLHIAGHYGNRYRVRFGAGKTKTTVTGSKVDREFYAETTPWKMDGEIVKVVEDNEHLGLVVSGDDEEGENVAARLSKGRKSLFGLLGPAFTQKCLLNPLLKLHIFRMYCDPIVRCGLSSMALRNTQMEIINKFQRQILRAFLSLSDRSPIPGTHFIFGELPLEAKIHRDCLLYTSPSPRD